VDDCEIRVDVDDTGAFMGKVSVEAGMLLSTLIVKNFENVDDRSLFSSPTWFLFRSQ
jgi:hypothetical protein